MNFTVLFFTLFTTATASAATLFKLQWDSQKLPFKVEMMRAYNPRLNRVAEHGVLTPDVKLPPAYNLPKSELSLSPNEEAVLILKLTNSSPKSYSFSVAPHSTEPGESALGFYFNCLCNGHVYKVGPQQTWYRIMKLSYRKPSSDAASVTLRHVIFETNSKAKLPAHSH